MEKVFKKYNTSFFVNYASDPTFLTSLMTTGPYTNDTTLQVNVKRNVTDKDTKIIGEAFYNIDFQSDKSLTFLQGPYTALQTFLTKNGIKKYVVFKSGFLEQILKQPVNPTNYNKCIVERSNIKHEIVQSVIIEDTFLPTCLLNILLIFFSVRIPSFDIFFLSAYSLAA
jgi:hypothetical protein